MVDIAQTTKKPAEDPFAAAFAQLTDEDTAAAAGQTEVKADPVIDSAAATEAAKPDPVTIEIEGALPDPKTVAADGTTPGTEPEPKTGEIIPPPEKLSDEQLLARFRDIVREPVAAAPAAPAAPATPAAPADPAAALSAYTPAQQEVVDNYIKEWPDVYQAEQLIRAREYQALVQHVFTQLAPVLQQLQGTTTQMAAQTHMEQLQAAVPDYAEVAPKVLAWIDQQPAYLKQAFTAVAAQGTVADVVDLIGRFRTSTGTAAPAAAPAAAAPAAAAPAAAAPANTNAAAVAKAVKGLAPVSTKRTGVQTDAIQPDDFEGAFKAFAAVG